MIIFPLRVLANHLKKFGMNEMIITLIECVDTEMVPTYLRHLVYLEWIKKHPIIQEEGEEDESNGL